MREAGTARASLERGIELGVLDAVPSEIREVVLGYHRDDCDSTLALRNWLESVRSAEVFAGAEIPRPALPEEDEDREPNERGERIERLVAILTNGVPVDETERTSEQHAKWLLAHCLDYYWRERRAELWEKYYFEELAVEEYAYERKALGGLEFVGEVGGTEKKPVHRYRFQPQYCQLTDESLKDPEKRSIGKI